MNRTYNSPCAPSLPAVVAAAAQAASVRTGPGQKTPGQIFVAIMRQNIETLKAELAEKQGELGGLQLALNIYQQNHPEAAS